MPRPSALILDYGGVLTRPQRVSSVEVMARYAGTDPGVFLAAYLRERDRYDAGRISAEEYWRRVFDALDRRGPIPEPTVERLIGLDVESWTCYREDAWTLARSFRAAGGRTAILSNCTPEILARIRADRRPEESFDAVVASCEIGCNKPARRIYESCLSRLDVTAGRALFADDSAANVAAAAQLGLDALHFTGDDSLRDLRRRLGDG